ncbi:ferritin-like domain-containing protein [Sphingomonas alba]|uniref:PA2169 family four-helix-bundle protein n=1 Tax=Sphingomonas alba TaxID=2908208 RepID=A0ABT0RKG9_9SPHN|nr:PA2169 family four-helix-bundle protein [Sphingomonas alba]MCL6683142.1 PA2169 family four-helix-bundle protein [Sphingomonas alba]
MIGKSENITILNTLTATLIDSVEGYRDAAQNTESGRFQELFRQMANERSTCVEDLRAEVRRLGGDAEDDQSTMGSFHQRWLDLKAAITGRDDKAIINEVERGEDYLKAKFEKALDDGELDGDSRSVVERAFQSVREGHDKVSALKHGMEAAS